MSKKLTRTAGEWVSRPVTGRRKGAILMTAMLLMAALVGATVAAPGVLAGEKGNSNKATTNQQDCGCAANDSDLVDIDGDNNTVTITYGTDGGSGTGTASETGTLQDSLTDEQFDALEEALTDEELATLNDALESGEITDAQVRAFAEGVLDGAITDAETSAAVTSEDIDAAVDAALAVNGGSLDAALNDTQLTAIDDALTDGEVATLDAALEAGTINDTQVTALADGLISGEITDAEASAAVTSDDIDAALTDLLTSAGLLSMGSSNAVVLG